MMSDVRALASERWIPNGCVCVFGAVLREDAPLGRVVGRRAYAIALRDGRLQLLGDDLIREGFELFFGHAARHPDTHFRVAGFSGAETLVSELMLQAPANCKLCSQEELLQSGPLVK